MKKAQSGAGKNRRPHQRAPKPENQRGNRKQRQARVIAVKSMGGGSSLARTLRRASQSGFLRTIGDIHEAANRLRTSFAQQTTRSLIALAEIAFHCVPLPPAGARPCLPDLECKAGQTLHLIFSMGKNRFLRK